MPHQDLVFYVLLGFFILIGLGSIGVLFNLVKASPEFKRWASRGFAAGTTSVIFGLFKVFEPAAAPPPTAVAALTPIHVTLDAPAVRAPFKDGKFEYIETKANGTDTVVHKGDLNPVLLPGGWEVVLPGEAAGHATALHLQDRDGGWWQTVTFYPNYMKQVVESGKEFAELRDDSWRVPGVAVLAAAEPGAAAGEVSGARFTNYAKRIEDRYQRAFYQWRVFVDEPASLLASIEQVDYVLHPTFPEPFQTTRDRNNKFAIEGEGWGGFNVLITVHYTNGTSTKSTYYLDLAKEWPAEPARAAAVSGTQLKLESIQVMQDGSTGSTSWSFDVLLDGKIALRLPSKAYDDTKSGTRRAQYPAEPNRSVVGTKIAPGRMARLEVRGRRTNAGDTATGEATVAANAGRITVTVANKDPRKGSFVFYFAAASS